MTAFQMTAIEGIFNLEPDFFGIVRFSDIFQGSVPQGKNGGVDSVICADYDYISRNVVVCDPLHHLQPGYVRKTDIEEHKINAPALQCCNCFNTGFTFQYF